MTRKEACRSVARSLSEFGYREISVEMIDEVLTAWLAGKRDAELPHGIIGRMAAAQFDDVEAEAPGRLRSLT